MFTPCTELPQLAGIVPTSVYGLGVLEGVRDVPALLVGQSDRSVRGVLCLECHGVPHLNA